MNPIKNELDQLDTKTMSAFFKLMSEEIRFKLTYLLAHDEKLCVTDLAEMVEASVATTSHHLQILKKNKLIKSERQGKQVLYFIDNPKIIHFINVGIDLNHFI